MITTTLDRAKAALSAKPATDWNAELKAIDAAREIVYNAHPTTGDGDATLADVREYIEKRRASVAALAVYPIWSTLCCGLAALTDYAVHHPECVTWREQARCICGEVRPCPHVDDCEECDGTGVKTDENGIQSDDVCPNCEGC